tara:strand:+ start:576 stop:1190 length:615 start_codon:yes stop_codon:yes gene_type:complete
MPPFNIHKLRLDTDKIAEKVFELRDYWISRSDQFTFYTLGRNAYKDGKTPAYKEDIKKLNPILRREFDVVYRIIIDHLSHQFNEQIYLNDDLAHPSFHIFGSSPFLLTHSGSWHQDKPHESFGLEPTDPYSFTVAIKLPTGGAGMDFFEDGIQKYLPYQEGEIIGHNGLILHRIASLKDYVPNEYRITLQGHLIRINGALNMFW